MTKKERIRAAIRGEKPDKMPYSFWTHMPGTDLDPEAISQKTYEFYKKYDFDFVKTMNNGMYAIEDFGCTVEAGLPVEMAFMRANGAFATDDADELTLTPAGRYLTVVLYRQYLAGLNNLREQARAKLPGDERDLLFGDGTEK